MLLLKVFKYVSAYEWKSLNLLKHLTEKENIDITYFLIGLLLGTIHNFSSWMFTATAGIFLYVALVDMMPELSSGHSHPISSNKQKEAHWLSLTLQVTHDLDYDLSKGHKKGTFGYYGHIATFFYESLFVKPNHTHTQILSTYQKQVKVS